MTCAAFVVRKSGLSVDAMPRYFPLASMTASVYTNPGRLAARIDIAASQWHL